MSNLENKGIKKLKEIKKNSFLTYPWWPFPKEVFQRTSYMEIKKIKRRCFVNNFITVRVLNTAKILRLSLLFLVL